MDPRLWNGGGSCRERSLWISTRPVWILRRAPRQHQDAAGSWFDQSHWFVCVNVWWASMVLWYGLLGRQAHLLFRSLGCAKCRLGRKSSYSSTCFATLPVGSQQLASSFRPKLLEELRRRGEEGAGPGNKLIRMWSLWAALLRLRYGLLDGFTLLRIVELLSWVKCCNFRDAVRRCNRPEELEDTIKDLGHVQTWVLPCWFS